MQKVTEDFLRRHGMHFDTIDLDAEREKFMGQMKDGLEGRPSSLMMIPGYITVTGEPIPTGKEVIVMDAGGTNFRIATVKSQPGGGMAIDNFAKHPMPGTRGQITIGAFFEQIADYMEPVLKVSDADTVGFCFSFVVEILPSREGRLDAFSKEVLVEGVDGDLIGESLNRVLEARGYKRRTFVLLNDTVATMLGGMASATGKDYSNYIGYILGTGTNTCYFEDCKNITKAPEASAMPGRMAINMESGIYSGFVQGDYDKELDGESQIPGDHQMEKMMSGAYQGGLIWRTARGAVAEGLFSAEFAGRFGQLSTFTMPQIDSFCAAPKSDGELAYLANGNQQDLDTLFDIVDASFERAARLAAILFSAIMVHSGCGGDAARPVCITAEGTSFTKAVLFRPKLDAYVKDYIGAGLGLHCDIISASDVTLTGSAIAALL